MNTLVLTVDQLWLLAGALRGEDQTAEAERDQEPILSDFLQLYHSGHWPTRIPVLPATGKPELDRVLGRVRSVAAVLLRQCWQISTDRAELQRHARDRSRLDLADGQVASALANIDNDGWLEDVVTSLSDVARRASTKPGSTGNDWDSGDVVA